MGRSDLERKAEERREKLGKMPGGPPAKKAMITNPEQLKKHVKRCMRKLNDKAQISVGDVTHSSRAATPCEIRQDVQIC